MSDYCHCPNSGVLRDNDPDVVCRNCRKVKRLPASSQSCKQDFYGYSSSGGGGGEWEDARHLLSPKAAARDHAAARDRRRGEWQKPPDDLLGELGAALERSAAEARRHTKWQEHDDLLGEYGAALELSAREARLRGDLYNSGSNNNHSNSNSNYRSTNTTSSSRNNNSSSSSSSNRSSSDNSQCPEPCTICMDTILRKESENLACAHTFHRACLDAQCKAYWKILKESDHYKRPTRPSCSSCRMAIPESRINSRRPSNLLLDNPYQPDELNRH